jgi:hypothetical protein
LIAICSACLRVNFGLLLCDAGALAGCCIVDGLAVPGEAGDGEAV